MRYKNRANSEWDQINKQGLKTAPYRLEQRQARSQAANMERVFRARKRPNAREAGRDAIEFTKKPREDKQDRQSKRLQINRDAMWTL